MAIAEPSSGNSPRGSYNHSTQPPADLARAPQDGAEVAGPVEDEALSPHQSRLAESSPHAATAETIASPVNSISHGLDTWPSSSSAQQPAAAAFVHALVPSQDNDNTNDDADDDHDGQVPAPLAAVHADAGTAVAPVPSVGSGPNGLEPLHPADMPVSRARRSQQSNILRRFTSAAMAANHRAAAYSPPGAANNHRATSSDRAALHRAVAASPSRGESGSPGSSVLAQLPADSTHGQAAHLRRGMSHDAELAGVVDSFEGAIMQERSDEEGNGEVVDERGMFQQCYKGHCNLSVNKEVLCVHDVLRIGVSLLVFSGQSGMRVMMTGHASL